MSALLTIGDFSRATHLSVKTLRHYHRIRLLEPADIDRGTGYRRYTTDQIPAAQVIRRFRDLDMPLEQIHAVLQAPDLQARNRLISAHLANLEQGLARTQDAVASLRDLLAGPSAVAPVSQRRVDATVAAAITGVVGTGDLLPWYLGALGELYATLEACAVAASGPAGGIYASELFSAERGEATIFVPTATEVQRLGRVAPVVVPAAELAVIVHPGPHADVDRAYGALGAYVASHALQVDGPIREYYLVGRRDTPDQNAWRTEIGWPIFSTGAAAARSPATPAPRRRASEPAELADLLVTRYPPGAGIGWHRDAAQFGEVSGVSLLTACRMRFRRGRPRAWETAELTLEPRSAYVLSGPARAEWQHHIPPVAQERWSMTFRTLRHAAAGPR